MTPERNVGGFDRLLRLGLAGVLVAVGIWATIATRHLLALGAFLAAGGFLFNVVTGFCGVNALLGVNTCSWDSGQK